MDDDHTISIGDLCDNFIAGKLRQNGSASPRSKKKAVASSATSKHQRPGPDGVFPMADKPAALAVSPGVKAVDPSITATTDFSTASQVAQPPAKPFSEPVERSTDELKLMAAPALYLFSLVNGTLNTGNCPDPCIDYLLRFRNNCNTPSDPMEQMLAESVMLAYHALGRLLVASASTTDTDNIVGLSAAASQLMGELRRGALAYQAYRFKARENKRAAANELQATKSKKSQRAKRNGDVIKNRKAVDSPRKRSSREKKAPDSKLGSNGNKLFPCIAKRFELPAPVA